MNYRLIIAICAISILTGCKTFDPKFLNGAEPTFNPKLPAVESYVENNLVAIVSQQGSFIGASPEDVKTVFNREVSEMMTNPYEDKRGFLILKVNTIDNKIAGMWGIVVGSITMGVGYLFGAPAGGSKQSVEVQIDVLNSNRKLIGSYRGSGTQKIIVSLYGKMNYRDPARVAYLLAVKQAIKEAKTKMLPDLNRLIEELKK